MIIGVLGHGASGASALVDILKEFEEIKLSKQDREFPIVYAPDGLLDLEFHLVKQPIRYYSSDISIYRFLEYAKKEQKYNLHYSKNCNGDFLRISKDFIEEITQVKWKGYWYFDYYFHTLLYDKFRFALGHRIDSVFEKYTKLSISKYRYMRVSVKPTNFYTSARKYIKNILDCMSIPTDGKVLLDMPFPYNNPEACFKYFDDPVAIIVNRDPRDVYIYFKEYFKESWIPCDTVDNFITYFKAIRNVDYTENERIVIFQYEDLVFHYKDIREKLIKILRINDVSEQNKNKYFNPEISVGNVQMYLRYPKYDDDIKKIEKELQEYLYDFPDNFNGLDTSKGKVIIYTESQRKS